MTTPNPIQQALENTLKTLEIQQQQALQAMQNQLTTTLQRLESQQDMVLQSILQQANETGLKITTQTTQLKALAEKLNVPMPQNFIRPPM